MNNVSTEELLNHIINWIKDAEGGNVEIDEHTPILAQSMLDSMNLLLLVSHFEKEYGISVGEDAMVPENFETPGQIARLFERMIVKLKQ